MLVYFNRMLCIQSTGPARNYPHGGLGKGSLGLDLKNRVSYDERWGQNERRERKGNAYLSIFIDLLKSSRIDSSTKVECVLGDFAGQPSRL